MNALQLKLARVALGLTVRQAADLCGVSHDTVTRIEAGHELKESTVMKVRDALETAGVLFIPENGGGPGVRLKKRLTPDGGAEMKIGDRVKYREDRAGADIKHLGKEGEIVNPGHRPPFPTHVCVEFDGDGGKWVDRGMLVRVGDAGG